jgi:syntaxin-binding protein 1
LATGQDEDHRKPKNLPDQVVRMLDEEAIIPLDRLRLIALYILYKNGILGADITKLLLHAGLPPQEANVLQNLEFFGARVSKPLTKSASAAAPPPLFPRSHPPPTAPNTEEISISRFVPQLRSLLDAHVAGTLDPVSFPYANPADAPVQPDPGAGASAASLRSAKPTWARGRLAAVEPRQRIVVFVAGGATWAEARAAYEVAAATSRDVVLATSHMLTPRLWLQQLGDLAVDRRALRLPADRPPKKAPPHLFEEEAPPPPPGAGQPGRAGQAQPPADRLAAMSLNGRERSGSASGSSGGRIQLGGSSGDDRSRKDKPGEGKRKHGFFGSKR